MVERGIKIRWEERMDNRTLSPEALSVYRRKAVESVIKHGLSQRKACMIFGFSETSMCKYMREYKENNEQIYEYKKRGARKYSESKIGEKEIGELIVDITPVNKSWSQEQHKQQYLF